MQVVVLVCGVLALLHCVLCNNVQPITKLKYSGMTFTGDKYCPNVTFSSASAKTSLYHLYTTGANAVAIIVTQYQDTHKSTNIYPLYTPVYSSYFTYVTAADDDLVVAIQYAHELGLKVMLKLQIDLTKDDSYWRGDIGGSFKDADWESWFSSYTSVLTHYATLSQNNNVEIFSMGCELVATSGQESRWRALTAQVRKIFNGTITDAANWGGEELSKLWWDAVDIIGVDAYYLNFGMTNYTDPTYDQIVANWQPIVKKLTTLSSLFKRPLMFSEIGYCPGLSCTRNHIPTAAELAYQARFYQAALDVFSPFEWFVGIFWWNWATDAAFGGANNDCMSPAYKPAELVLRQYYQATLPQPPPPTYPASCLCTL